MANPNKTKLDASQCIVDAYDGVDESNRIQLTNPVILDAAQKTVDTFDSVNSSQKVSIVNSIEYAIELNAADGDSVLTFHNTIVDGSLTNITSATNPPNLTSLSTNCSSYSNCAVYSSISGGGVASPGYVRIQVSPSDVGDTDADWHYLSGNIIAGSNPDGTVTGTTGVSQTYSFCARRIRIDVPTAGKPGAGKVVSYKLILRS
jgi:hypothetical protein